MEAHGGTVDPQHEIEAAHETAAVLVRTGRARRDPQLTDKLVELVDDLGLSTVAELWSRRPARSLPGALWRLYLLREWVRRAPEGASRDYAAGLPFTAVDRIVAGAAEPIGPQQLRELTDEILRGVFAGDLAVALHRAASFCRVVSAGRAERSDGVRPARQAASLLTTAEDLERCAALWRAGELV